MRTESIVARLSDAPPNPLEGDVLIVRHGLRYRFIEGEWRTENALALTTRVEALEASLNSVSARLNTVEGRTIV